MIARPFSRRLLVSYVGFFLVFAGAAARGLFEFREPPDVWYIAGALAFYFILLLVEPRLVDQNLRYLHVVNILQTGLGIFLLSSRSEQDYYALLFIPPCALSMMYFSRKTAYAWIGVICLFMVAILLVNFPLEESVGFVITYPTAIFLFVGLSYLARQAEEAKNRSEKLLDDLQVANRQLHAYAAQVKELAAAEERNRLARELHDSVTQTIFSLTLTAQAARILQERNPARVGEQLDHIQTLAQNALAEMRALIQQLHPRPAGDEGLAGALRRMTANRKASDGLSVDLQISGERRLPANIEQELLRIVQESLNNIVKHAHTDRAVVTLQLEDQNLVCMSIEDDGAGFDPAAIRSLPGHLGLTSMSERIQALGGTLAIDSKPGRGTRLRIELNVPRPTGQAG